MICSFQLRVKPPLGINTTQKKLRRVIQISTFNSSLSHLEVDNELAYSTSFLLPNSLLTMACVPTIANPYLNDTSVSCRLRDYQSRMVETVMRENTIILLPTGAGKTAIAASTISRFVLGNSASKALFFVPAIALVSQQANALREWIEAPVCKIGQFHGDKSFPEEFTVLVTTPKAFESALLQGSRDCMWSNFSVIVFDEVHHAIKDHPYRSLAMRLGHSNCHPRIIGLTASLTYAVGEAKVQRASQRLCSLLQISRIEVADEQE